jgi:hypothetical protein
VCRTNARTQEPVIKNDRAYLSSEQRDAPQAQRHQAPTEIRSQHGIQHKGKPWRILFAFDPNRNVVVLVGGTKVGKEDWYDVHIPIADQRFAQYLSRLKKPKKE